MRPRAKVLRRRCHDLLDALGQRDDPLLKLTMELEQIALEDDFLIERKLYPMSFLLRHRFPVRNMRADLEQD